MATKDFDCAGQSFLRLGSAKKNGLNGTSDSESEEDLERIANYFKPDFGVYAIDAKTAESEQGASTNT